MREWVTIELVVGALLVTSFTTVGLIALWAATSRWHWFLRIAVVLALISPILLVPAYEPFLVFAIETCAIVAGVKLWPYMRRLQWIEVKQDNEAARDPTRGLRFILRMLLIATPIVVLISLPSPLLGFPIYGPALVFAFEASAILAGVAILLAAAKFCRLLKHVRFKFERVELMPAESDAGTSGSNFRFSLRTLLLITPVVAVVVAIGAQIAMHLGPQSAESVTTMLLNGLGSGIAVLLAAWMSVTRIRVIVWPVAIGLSLGLAALLAWFDWIFQVFSNSMSWPPTAPTTVAFFGPLQTHPQLAWLLVLPAIVLLTLLAVILVRFTNAPAKRAFGPLRWARISARAVLGAFVIVLAAFPVTILWQLLHPLPLPTFTQPDPNGIDLIVAAAKAIDGSPILNTSVEPLSTAQLAAEIAKYQSTYDQLHLGLTQEIRVRPWPRNKELLESFMSLDTIQYARSAARGLFREAELARQQNRLDDALRITFDQIRFGRLIPRDGLLVDFLVGIAIEGIGHHSLHEMIEELDADQYESAIATITELEKLREPLENVLHRDRIWSQNAFGWLGHLQQIFEDIAPQWNTAANVQQLVQRDQAISRLLIVELAIRRYRIRHGDLPNALDDLVPDFVSQIPIDPFDPAQNQVRYLRDADSYKLYSVGHDGQDDLGHATDRYSSLAGSGQDLRLDVYFAPEPAAETGGGVGQVDDADAEADSEVPAAGKQSLDTPGRGSAKHDEDENEPLGKIQDAVSK